MSRETWVPLATVVGLALVAVIAWSWLGASNEAARETERQAREREEAEAHAHDLEEQEAESRTLLTEVLPGVVLGADLASVRAARPADALTPSTSHTDPGLDLYEEALTNGAQVMYAFDESSGELVRIQILSMLDTTDDLVPHLAAMNERYGAPTGIWDCRDEGGIATRRFTWRRAHVGLADIVLVVGTRVSVTLYVTSNAQMASSIRRAGCRPMEPGSLESFPTSSPDDVQRIQEAEGSPR